jgi:hypothetical protein
MRPVSRRSVTTGLAASGLLSGIRHYTHELETPCANVTALEIIERVALGRSQGGGTHWRRRSSRTSRAVVN